MNNNQTSVEKMWCEFLASIGETPDQTDKEYTSWHFCNNPQDADGLAELVKQGKKKATASALWLFTEDEVPAVGDYSIITDWAGTAQCIIRTTKIEIVSFNEVTPEFAAKEGEGDLSLSYWRKVHKEFFKQELEKINREFSVEMPVICEEFEVVY